MSVDPSLVLVGFGRIGLDSTIRSTCPGVQGDIILSARNPSGVGELYSSNGLVHLVTE